jgi:hypothetical protein
VSVTAIRAGACSETSLPGYTSAPRLRAGTVIYLLPGGLSAAQRRAALHRMRKQRADLGCCSGGRHDPAGFVEQFTG